MKAALEVKSEEGRDVMIAYHKLVWDRCQKEVWVSRKVLEQACFSAVLHFNDGATSLLRVLECMGVSKGYFTEKISSDMDSTRIQNAQRKCSDAAKKRRKTEGSKKGIFLYK